jgi:hypothetical protein
MEPRLPAQTWKQWLLLAVAVVGGLLIYTGWVGA